MVVRASDIRSKAFLHRATAFLVSLAFLAQIASAQAQNQFDWTGFYAGPHVGYGSMRAKSTLDYLLNGIPTSLASVGSEEIPDSYRINSSGFAGGGQAGFNFQSNKLVFGFEADLSFLTLNGSSTATGTVTSGSPPITMGFISSRSQKIQWLGTVRGRVGHTASDSLLLYLTGGLALGGVEDSMRLSFLSVGGTTYAGSSRSTRTGWTVGGGAEIGNGNNLSTKIEYLYFDLGKTTLIGLDVLSPNQPFRARSRFNHNGHIIRVGLNYKFGPQ
jgi:outer membrane immunogenic protein